MKKILILIIILILFSVIVNAERIRVDLIKQDPDPVRSGDVVEVKFKLDNSQDLTKNDVKVEILPNYPFALYSENSTKDFGRIDSREVVYFDFKLKVDNTAADGKHDIVLKLYEGDTVWLLKDAFYIEVENKRLELKPYIVASDIVTHGSSGKFTIEIANVGRQNIDALELELLESKDYKLLSTSNYVYIGDLEADDTESEDFSIYVNDKVHNVNIPLKLRYEVNDKIYDEDFNLILNLLTEEEAKKIGLIKNSSVTYIIVVIIILVALFFIYKKFRKK